MTSPVGYSPSFGEGEFSEVHGSKRGADMGVASRYGPTPMRVPGCDWLPSRILVTSSGFLIMPIGRAPRYGGGWRIGPGQWDIRVELFSLGVDA